MKKEITKKSLIERALANYTEKQINDSTFCEVVVLTKNDKKGTLNFPITNRWKKTKANKIRSNIRSFLLNTIPDEFNKRHSWNTSSENIDSISIELKYKIEEFNIENINKWFTEIDNKILFNSNKIITLIWENWAWKSRILEKIFTKYIDEKNINLLAFSSGQNEWFSEIFNKHKKNNKKYSRENKTKIKDFYFDYSWSRFLVFLAGTLKTGFVKQYLNEKWYTDDFDMYINFQFRIKKNYLDKILNEYEREAKWEFIEELYRNTLFHKFLEKIAVNYDKNYDFLDEPKSITKQFLHFNSKDFTDVYWNNIEEIFTFLSHATHWNDKNIFLESTQLQFKNNLEFKNLSDWEYQLLVVYSILDLFDSENTLFLFDEIDSHLHYSNINILWEKLKNIQWKIITTTHLPDSILNNNIDDIKVVEKWVVNNDNTANTILKRLENISDKSIYEIRLMKKIENIVLMDDLVDWLIFKKLVKKKLWIACFEKLENITSYKRSSSYDNTNEAFWKGKLMFVEDFKKVNKNCDIKTKNIFLICDRDKLAPTEIKDNLEVNINNSYSGLKNFNENKTKTYLLSWKRLEIENYLLYKELLINNNIKPHINYDAISSLDNIEDIAILDCKNITHPLYKENWFNEWKLNSLISKIPKEEISEDIEKMYDFIISKI